MLEVLTKGFRDASNYLLGFRTLTEENLGEALRMIRGSLLEADVEFQVARGFLDRVKEKALGGIVLTRVAHKEKKIKVSPGEHFIKLCHDELIDLLGPVDSSLSLKTKPVSAVMMVGLQGSGKTTTAAKLAKYLIKKGKKPMLVAADVYRPAAMEQLRKLGTDLEIPVFSDGGSKPPDICAAALQEARNIDCDVAIFDTAGRLTIDEPLMEELEQIRKRTSPDDVFLVCDAMIGQESVNVATAFNRRIRLTGFILTKLDGDARGGAAISIKEATGVSIKFVGMGESLDRLEEFRPDGLASRILGFGDVVGLVKDFEEVVDERKAEEDTMRLLSGRFDLSDFLSQLKTIKKMGPLQDLVEKLPMFAGGIPGVSNVDDYELVRMESMINSMTPSERSNPDIINYGRCQRIARGSGRKESEVKDLVARFKDMRNLMAAMGGGKLRGRLKKMKGLRSTLGQGLGSGMSPADPSFGYAGPPGMPEIGSGKAFSKKALEKRRKKTKEAKKARKKARRH